MKNLNLSRRKVTKEVLVGGVGVGGDNPIRIQSMVTSPTTDVLSTVNQITRLVDCGCEIVRLAIRGMADARACEEIKNMLSSKGYDVPLVADVHFYPAAAILVSEFVDKVRINPGNFLPVNKLYENEEAALEFIESSLGHLLDKCRRRSVAIRIGVNHGSLSDRILKKFGNTPEGMVVSAFEFAHACHSLDFHDIIFSMKSSDIWTMVSAYRLLVDRMDELGWKHPVHLGVTEAGSGIDGIVKSCIGIGSLLVDGIGDTIRVSLTEDSVNEIRCCKKLIHAVDAISLESVDCGVNRGDFLKRAKMAFILDESRFSLDDKFSGCNHCVDIIIKDKKDYGEQIDDLTSSGVEIIDHECTLDIEHIYNKGQEQIFIDDSIHYLLLNFSDSNLTKAMIFRWLQINSVNTPVLLKFPKTVNDEQDLIRLSVEFGYIFLSGYASGFVLNDLNDDCIDLSLTILQVLGLKKSRTEFISCPGCGRTSFDIVSVTEKIKKRVGHLPNTTIAIMGCIVNGPGEMMHADFGCMGAGKNLMNLYVGKKCVKEGIPANDIDEELINLIKSHGMWIDDTI